MFDPTLQENISVITILPTAQWCCISLKYRDARDLWFLSVRRCAPSQLM